MNILIEKDNKEYVLDTNKLFSNNFLDMILPKEENENVLEPVDIEIDEIKNPILFKDKNMVLQKNNLRNPYIVIYNVGRSKVTLKYDSQNVFTNLFSAFSKTNNLKILNNYFDEILAEYSCPLNYMFNNKIIREPFIKFLKNRFEETNYNIQLDFDTGLYLVKNNNKTFWFIDDVTLDKAVRKINREFNSNIRDNISYVRELVSSDSDVFLNNIYNGSHEICWNSYKEPLSLIIESNKSKYGFGLNANFAPLMKSISSLFLSSIFNNDLTSRVSFKNKNIINIMSKILNYDYSKYLQGEDLESLQTYIENNSSIILRQLQEHSGNFRTPDILLLATIFEIPYSDFY